jgi:sortase (surface protein transpeptidase)
MARSVPVSVRIPALGVQSTLIQLGLNADGTIEVPPVTRPGQAGWYGHGPTPGEAGPAVVLGHVDGSGQPGVFHDLHRLTVGDRIEITRADHSVASFAVRETTRVPKNGFPTQAVYGETPNPQLRLITCGGEFDRAAGSYVDNIVVYADLANTA